MVKVGDRVRFLNSVGGGIVRSFQNKDIVLVEEEDGFETPVLVRECVVIESVSRETNKPQGNTTNMPSSNPIIIREEPEEEIEFEETNDGEELSVYLAFLPQDEKQLQTTAYDVYLVNDCNYFLHYNVATLGLEANSVGHGVIEPNTKFLFAKLDKDQLNDWERITVQLIPFKKKTYAPKPAVDVEIKINPVKFYKLHSFVENDFFYENALMLTVIEKDGFAQEMIIDPQQLKEQMAMKKDKPRRARIEKKAVKINDIIEVDLHIDELLDSTAGMSNADILQYQLEEFHKILQENRNKKGQKIVFIHGKGEGVLRKEIMKELKQKYGNFYVQDASFKEYGFGATMVTIR